MYRTSKKAGILENEIRHWFCTNNYDRNVIDMLTDSEQEGYSESFI